MASEIDLPWTCVAGSAALVANLLAERRIEAQRATDDESCQRRVTGWLAEVIEAAVAELFESVSTTIETSQGTVRADLDRSGRWRRGRLRTSRVGRNGVTGCSTSMLDQRNDELLREHVSGYLTSAVIALVGG